jgi:hypothetical protein
MADITGLAPRGVDASVGLSLVEGFVAALAGGEFAGKVRTA